MAVTMPALGDFSLIMNHAMTDTAPTAWAILRLGTGQDHEAWSWLVEHHGERLRRLVSKLLDDRWMAEDALQEVHLAIRRGAPAFQATAVGAEAAAIGWLMRVAWTAIIKTAKKHRRRLHRERPLAPEHHARPHPSHSDSTKVAQAAMVAAALAGLPERHRQPLVLHFHLGLPYPELAAALRTTEGNARVRVHRALAVLRARCACVTAEHLLVPALLASAHLPLATAKALPMVAGVHLATATGVAVSAAAAVVCLVALPGAATPPPAAPAPSAPAVVADLPLLDEPDAALAVADPRTATADPLVLASNPAPFVAGPGVATAPSPHPGGFAFTTAIGPLPTMPLPPAAAPAVQRDPPAPTAAERVPPVPPGPGGGDDVPPAPQAGPRVVELRAGRLPDRDWRELPTRDDADDARELERIEVLAARREQVDLLRQVRHEHRDPAAREEPSPRRPPNLRPSGTADATPAPLTLMH